MSADILIRPIERSDEPAWRGLWKAYLAFYETALPDALYRSTFDRFQNGDLRDPKALVAVTPNGERIGLVHYLFHSHAWKIEDVCYLQDLFVCENWRGKGVARALMEAVYDIADQRGAASVYWMTQSFNTDARKLYDRVGAETPFIKYIRP